MRPLERLEKTWNLPLGHYDRTAAEEAVEREYEKCKLIELAWMKRLGKKRKHLNYLSLNDACKLVYDICHALGYRCPSRLILRSKEVPPMAAACYLVGRREIHFVFTAISVRILIHELTHHVLHEDKKLCHTHGSEFCDYEMILIEVTEEVLRKS